MEGGLMSKANDPHPNLNLNLNLNLEQQRKRAKELRRAHADGSFDAAERIVGHLPRTRGQTVTEVLASRFTLSEAQLVVAREAGFSSWPRLKRHIELSRLGIEGGLETLLSAGIVGDSAAVQAELAASPELARRSIHVAAALGDAQAALQLLDDDPSRATERGGLRQWTPLFYCCSSRHRRDDASITGARVRIAERLLALGADANDEIATYDAPGGFRSVLQGAAREVASAELVGVLLEARASLLPAFGAAGPPIPLTDAVSGGNLACLERLLAAQPDAWQAREALETAVFHDRSDMAKILVEYGAQPNAAGRWWGYGGSCLHAAILLRRGKEMLRVLLASDVETAKRDPGGRTAYAVAVRTGHDVAAALLRERGASDGELSDVDRVIAAGMRLDRREVRRLLAADPDLAARYRDTDHLMLGWAVHNGRAAAVPLLLEARLDPSVVDADGDTALHLAAAAAAAGQKGDGDDDGDGVVAALLAAGASPAARNYHGRPPFGDPLPVEEQRERDELFERAADAVAFGDLETLRELVDEEPDLVHWRSPRPHLATLLLYCGANGTESARQRTPPNAPAIAQLLLDRGADPNAAGKFYGGGRGMTTLALVLTSVFPIDAGLDAELVRVLVHAGARLDLWPDSAPLVWAIERGRYRSALVLAEAGVAIDNLVFAAALNRVDILDDLLSRGIDVNTRMAGQTALHAAAVMGHKEAVTLLLDRRVDPTLPDTRWNRTAAQKARDFKHAEIAQIIEERISRG
jgi:ankyrin repeat protein